MRIGIIGAGGNMGKAVANLLVKNGQNPCLSDIKGNYAPANITIENTNIIFICVKPVEILSVLDDFSYEDKNKLLISCVAGINMEKIKKEISAPIIRCMMNLPIATGEGTITYIKNSRVTPVHHYSFKKILYGPKLVEVEKEKLIDVSTVLSGCLPGFASYLAEEYINFGVRHGFTYQESLDLYTYSIEGTMNMLRENETKEIIKKVSSPNGITVKGIEVLENYNVQNIIRTSLETAYQKFT